MKVLTKAIIAGAILAASVGYLAYRGIAAGKSYYLSVDKFLADPSYHRQRVRLYGVVGREGLSMSLENPNTAFALAGDARKLRVRYQGVVPDTFRVGQAVVVSGRMGSDGAFEADELLTKCASKYEAKARGEGGSP